MTVFFYCLFNNQIIIVIRTHLYLLVLSVPERNMNGLITVKGIKKQANFSNFFPFIH